MNLEGKKNQTQGIIIDDEEATLLLLLNPVPGRVRDQSLLNIELGNIARGQELLNRRILIRKLKRNILNTLRIQIFNISINGKIELFACV